VNGAMLRAAVVAGAVALPALARAQVERLNGRVDERTRTAVAAIVDSARGAGVPADPLVNKALEGASKGADGSRIVVAVRALAADLAGARAALGHAATSAELVAGAAALRAGVAPLFVARLRGAYPRELLVVPLAVMADLVARGVPADTAAQSVLALMQEGVRDADLVAFRQSVERDIALGAPAGGAVEARIGALSSTSAVPAPIGGEGPGNPTAQPPRKP